MASSSSAGGTSSSSRPTHLNPTPKPSSLLPISTLSSGKHSLLHQELDEINESFWGSYRRGNQPNLHKGKERAVQHNLRGIGGVGKSPSGSESESEKGTGSGGGNGTSSGIGAAHTTEGNERTRKRKRKRNWIVISSDDGFDDLKDKNDQQTGKGKAQRNASSTASKRRRTRNHSNSQPRDPDPKLLSAMFDSDSSDQDDNLKQKIDPSKPKTSISSSSSSSFLSEPPPDTKIHPSAIALNPGSTNSRRIVLSDDSDSEDMEKDDINKTDEQNVAASLLPTSHTNVTSDPRAAPGGSGERTMEKEPNGGSASSQGKKTSGGVEDGSRGAGVGRSGREKGREGRDGHEELNGKDDEYDRIDEGSFSRSCIDLASLIKRTKSFPTDTRGMLMSLIDDAVLILFHALSDPSSPSIPSISTSPYSSPKSPQSIPSHQSRLRYTQAILALQTVFESILISVEKWNGVFGEVKNGDGMTFWFFTNTWNFRLLRLYSLGLEPIASSPNATASAPLTITPFPTIPTTLTYAEHLQKFRSQPFVDWRLRHKKETLRPLITRTLKAGHLGLSYEEIFFGEVKDSDLEDDSTKDKAKDKDKDKDKDKGKNEESEKVEQASKEAEPGGGNSNGERRFPRIRLMRGELIDLSVMLRNKKCEGFPEIFAKVAMVPLAAGVIRPEKNVGMEMDIEIQDQTATGTDMDGENEDSAIKAYPSDHARMEMEVNGRVVEKSSGTIPGIEADAASHSVNGPAETTNHQRDERNISITRDEQEAPDPNRDIAMEAHGPYHQEEVATRMNIDPHDQEAQTILDLGSQPPIAAANEDIQQTAASAVPVIAIDPAEPNEPQPLKPNLTTSISMQRNPGPTMHDHWTNLVRSSTKVPYPIAFSAVSSRLSRQVIQPVGMRYPVRDGRSLMLIALFDGPPVWSTSPAWRTVHFKASPAKNPIYGILSAKIGPGHPRPDSLMSMMQSCSWPDDWMSVIVRINGRARRLVPTPGSRYAIGDYDAGADVKAYLNEGDNVIDFLFKTSLAGYCFALYALERAQED